MCVSFIMHVVDCRFKGVKKFKIRVIFTLSQKDNPSFFLRMFRINNSISFHKIINTQIISLKNTKIKYTSTISCFRESFAQKKQYKLWAARSKYIWMYEMFKFRTKSEYTFGQVIFSRNQLVLNSIQVSALMYLIEDPNRQ